MAQWVDKRSNVSYVRRRIQPLNANLACPIFYLYCFNDESAPNCIFSTQKKVNKFFRGLGCPFRVLIPAKERDTLPRSNYTSASTRRLRRRRGLHTFGVSAPITQTPTLGLHPEEKEKSPPTKEPNKQNNALVNYRPTNVSF